MIQFWKNTEINSSDQNINGLKKSVDTFKVKLVKREN